MKGWRQVAGDMSWDRHGVVLALVAPAARQVHLVRIEPWIEHDKAATVTHGLWVVDEKTLDFEDLRADRDEVRGALRSTGLGVAEYRNLTPEHKAEVLASYSGYDESRSVDKLAEALPAPVEEIEFWHGRETTAALRGHDEDMRREALEANFETRLTFGTLPPGEALAFALGGEDFEIELQGQDALAFEYAVAVAAVPGRTDTSEEFSRTVQALAGTPGPQELGSEDVARVERVLAGWAAHHGDPADEEGGIAAAAQSLASSMMSAIGFEWI